MKRIDMYNKSRRTKNTRLCIVYARKRAIEWLGNTAWHQCDNSCSHQDACERCKFYHETHEAPIGTQGMSCLRE
ncbi:MAG: hypothetical protein ACTSPB_20595 [Candidatus Thorarchaeota archaeon]